MPQQVYPNQNTEKPEARQKRLRESLVVHPGFHPRQPIDVQGSMNLETHDISLGCNEENTVCVLWHEQMHKLLIEMFDFKTTIQWDNITGQSKRNKIDLEKWFFDEMFFPDLNYYGQTHGDDKQ